jgi:hypothetical protein
MTITEYEYAATTVRALMAAETAMASVNCGAANVTRAQAEKLLDDYFTRVEQAIPWTEINPLDRRSWSERHGRLLNDIRDAHECVSNLRRLLNTRQSQCDADHAANKEKSLGECPVLGPGRQQLE